MMTIIVLVTLMAIAMEEMSEASSTYFALEEPTRMTRMILNNKDNNKSSTKFFMKESNKDEGVSCLDGLYDVPRKEENVLGKKKNKENSEIKIKVKGGSLMWEKGNFRTRKEDSLSNMCVCAQQHISFHFSYPMASGGSSPFFGEEVMAITSGGGCKDPAPKNV